MLDQDILLRLAVGLLLGGCIGFERRLRGHEAGPHVNALVAAGAALFVVTGIELGGDAGQRVLAQVATGVGFLAGGVILRDGLHVRGLNTAGTMWCVAAVGCVVGLGRVTLAFELTVLFIVANSLFHLLEHRVKLMSEDNITITSEREGRK